MIRSQRMVPQPGLQRRGNEPSRAWRAVQRVTHVLNGARTALQSRRLARNLNGIEGVEAVLHTESTSGQGRLATPSQGERDADREGIPATDLHELLSLGREHFHGFRFSSSFPSHPELARQVDAPREGAGGDGAVDDGVGDPAGAVRDHLVGERGQQPRSLWVNKTDEWYCQRGGVGIGFPQIHAGHIALRGSENQSVTRASGDG